MAFNIDKERQSFELLKKLPKLYNVVLSHKENKVLKGFLIEECPLWERLEKSFEKYFLEEVLFSAKRFIRETTEPTGLLKSRVLYLNVFKEGVENAIIFDSGREFLKIYLLAHLKLYKKLLPEVPSILSSVIPNFPQEKAEDLKLKLFYGLWQEIKNLLEEKESMAYELWLEIFNAPQFFLEKELKIPQNFPWHFGEIFYKLSSEKIKRYLSDAIIQAKDFLNSRDGKSIVINFFKKEISVEEAICSDEILNLLTVSEETYKFMKILSLNLRYGEIFKNYLDVIYFCKKIEDNYFLDDLKLEDETKPLKFGMAGVINPVIFRYFFILKINNLSENFRKIVLMDAKSYGEFLKEKEKLEIFSTTQAEKNFIYFEKYIKDGMLFSSRNPKYLFEYSLEIFFSFLERENAFLNTKEFKGFLGMGSFYLLPFYYPKNETKYEIVGKEIDDGLNMIKDIEMEGPFFIITYPYLQALFQNLEIKNLEVYKTNEGISLRISFKNLTFLIYPIRNETALVKPKTSGEVLKTLEPHFSNLKINELIEGLKDFST